MNAACFEIRYRLGRGHELQFGPDGCQELLIPPSHHMARISISQRLPPDTAKDRRATIVISSGPYDTEDAALSAGAIARSGVMIWAVKQRIGIDFREEQQSGVTGEGKEWIKRQFGLDVRSAVSGLQILPAGEKSKAVSCTAIVTASVSAKGVVDAIEQATQHPECPSERQVVASELYCASFLDTIPRSRFITMVTAVEALMEHREQHPVLMKVIEDAIGEVARTVGPETPADDLKQSLQSSLQYLRLESKGMAGRRLIESRLADRIYGGMPAKVFFRKCYDTRSQILHSGDSEANISELLSPCQDMVGDLLASFLEPKCES